MENVANRLFTVTVSIKVSVFHDIYVKCFVMDQWDFKGMRSIQFPESTKLCLMSKGIIIEQEFYL